MVEHSLALNSIFGSLADPTRRDILRRVSKNALSISEIRKSYKISFAAVAKHVSILERAKLVIKRRYGREQIVQIAPAAFRNASHYLQYYEKMWNERFDRLDELLKNN